MANWITHMRIADEVLNLLPELDRLGFCMGSIAPDCNVENEDWTAFTPPREVTHWMSGRTRYKTFADCEAFYDQRIRGRRFADRQEHSFYLGYWAHLMADVTYINFLRDEERVKNMWQRIRAVPEMAQQAQDSPETFDAVKHIWGRKRRMAGLEAMESEYVYAHPETAYRTVLQTVKTFPDYLEFLPKGAILRKIGVMGGMPEEPAGEIEQIFVTREELDGYIVDTCRQIAERISSETILF